MTRQRALPALRVSENNRYLVRQDGTPFFWLGDTAWELFHRSNQDEVLTYLDNRAALGFTVVQAVALAELDGLSTPNSHGKLPFVDGDPTRPAVTERTDPRDDEQYGYWDHVDYIVEQAADRGIYTAMLPTWGRWVDDGVITTDNAEAYGEFLGSRYADSSIVWVLGGDRPADGNEGVWRAMAKGIAIGVTGSEDYSEVLMTYHPRGGQSSSIWFHDEPWLAFNMLQTGHCRDSPAWAPVGEDYDLAPAKPVVDGEPLYESHPGFCDAQEGYSTDYDVRKMAWWDVFAGAAGHTYGNHGIWQMWTPGHPPVTAPLAYWYDAIHEPGGTQMQYLRALIESRPPLTRIPDQNLLLSDPGRGGDRIQATRDCDGHYAFIYSAAGQPFTVDMTKISGKVAQTWWYDPRTGEAIDNGVVSTGRDRGFTPPSQGRDWTLVIDDAGCDFPQPGTP